MVAIEEAAIRHDRPAVGFAIVTAAILVPTHESLPAVVPCLAVVGALAIGVYIAQRIPLMVLGD
jgi:hypothetical protein